MTVDISRAPFPVTVRELWLPRAINGNATLPRSRYNGHELALTGARKGTTTDGCHFLQGVNSYINYGPVHNAVVKLWVKLRVRLTQGYNAGDGDQYLWSKRIDATHYLWLVFKTADGKLYFEGDDGGVNTFSVAAQDGAADITSWNAGQWYTILASISDANAVRLIVDDGTVVIDASVIAAPNGGNAVIGDQTVGGGVGVDGAVVVDYVLGTDDLSQAAPDEEYDLYVGIPPADAVNSCLLDEGCGFTANDRGTGGNAGTLGSAVTWAYGECKHPVLSLDGINDIAISAAGVDISGDLTVVWVAKMKSSYNVLSDYHHFYRLWIDGNNGVRLYYRQPTNDIRWNVEGGAVEQSIITSLKPLIDDYWIVIGTSEQPNGIIKLFINGSLIGTLTGAGIVSAAAATAYIGRDVGLASYDISKPLMVGLFDTAFTEKQALAFSRWLDNILHMGIGI